jgi:hypothetical protein
MARHVLSNEPIRASSSGYHTSCGMQRNPLEDMQATSESKARKPQGPIHEASRQTAAVQQQVCQCDQTERALDARIQTAATKLQACQGVQSERTSERTSEVVAEASKTPSCSSICQTDTREPCEEAKASEALGVPLDKSILAVSSSTQTAEADACVDATPTAVATRPSCQNLTSVSSCAHSDSQPKEADAGGDCKHSPQDVRLVPLSYALGSLAIGIAAGNRNAQTSRPPAVRLSASEFRCGLPVRKKLDNQTKSANNAAVRDLTAVVHVSTAVLDNVRATSALDLDPVQQRDDDQVTAHLRPPSLWLCFHCK